jgi:spore coat polysaccharide biosynthesis protein SpsF
MSRRLVAALACRNQGSRLYAKPLQNLDVERGIRILDNIVGCLRTLPCIEEIVLGISDGQENEVFRTIADAAGLPWIVGDQRDVLSRLIQCGERAAATDIFRVTTESPFPYFEAVEELWRRHQREGADATFVWDIIDGAGFEIYTLDALKTSHARGSARHRSELCSLYVREHPDEFKILRVDAPPVLRRKDIRLTVDYPEDLVVCRRVYQELQAQAPRIAVADVVAFLDRQPRLLTLIAPYTEAGYAVMDLWDRPLTRADAAETEETQ